MVAGASVHHFEVHVRPGPLREPLEEVVHELGLQIADPRRPDPQVHRGVRPAREIDRGDGQRFVHRHDEVPGALDAAARAERLVHGLAERDAEVLDRVMLVDVEVSPRVDDKVETRRGARRARACGRET